MHEGTSIVKSDSEEKADNFDNSEVKNDSFDLYVNQLISKHNIPGAGFALIKDGSLHSTRNYGILQQGEDTTVNDETMFSVGSISKVVNAFLILKLVDEGKLNLDEDVNKYLVDWKVENNEYTEEGNPVTLKAILSHKAGFSVSGFADYLPEEVLPTTVQILNGAGPAKNEKVELIHPVGSKWQYSGGGVTVSQKVIEDVTGMAYHEAAEKILFEPLGLERTTYENPLPESWGNIAKAHNENGDKVALPRGYHSMPEAAASGLWTTPSDLAKILIAFYHAKEGMTESFLSTNLCHQMVTEIPDSNQYGLGPGVGVYKGEKIMEHTGSNDSYKAYFAFFYEKGNGYVAVSNGSNGMDFLMEKVKYFLDYSKEL